MPIRSAVLRNEYFRSSAWARNLISLISFPKFMYSIYYTLHIIANNDFGFHQSHSKHMHRVINLPRKAATTTQLGLNWLFECNIDMHSK